MWHLCVVMQLGGAMMFRVVGSLVAFMCFFGGLPCQATTLFDTGSGTTKDSATNLEWLDVSSTFGQSYQDVLARLGNTSDSLYGYRYATGAEVQTLVADAGVVDASYFTSGLTSSEQINLYDFINLLGPYDTSSYGQTELGLYGVTADTGGAGQYYAGYYYYASSTVTYSGYVHYSSLPVTSPTSGQHYGSFLVRDVAATPIPATLPLFATGLGAFGLLGWRRKRKAAALAA